MIKRRRSAPLTIERFIAEITALAGAFRPKAKIKVFFDNALWRVNGISQTLEDELLLTVEDTWCWRKRDSVPARAQAAWQTLHRGYHMISQIGLYAVIKVDGQHLIARAKWDEVANAGFWSSGPNVVSAMQDGDRYLAIPEPPEVKQ